jgi:molybdate transport system regulatory protein
MAHLTIRIDLGTNLAFGPGKARLLELIEETGSIRRAAAAMEMSYRRAWLLIRETETMMKVSVVSAKTGGRKGGGTTLTSSGRLLVECYRAIETQAERAVLAQLREFAAMAKNNTTAAGQKKKITRGRLRNG